jgi:N-acetylmuramoyl-L-alanine amidase
VNLKTLFLTKNLCYETGKKHTPRGIMVHSTGANNPQLSRYVSPDDGLLGVNPYNNHWNQPTPSGRKVCPHAFIGRLKDGSIATYQTLPWDMAGWHSGSGKLGSAQNANNTGYIGFEICEDGLTDPAYFRMVYREAVEFAAYLCALYNIRPVKPYLIDHSEGNQLGIASNHADVMHWFPKHGKSMDTFRADVNVELANITNSDLLKAVEKISSKVPGGINIAMWAGSDREWKAKYVDTLLIKIANAWK